MLRTSRRLLKPGGRLAFFTIEVPHGVSGASRRRAVQAGPPAAGSRRPVSELLQAAGFTDVTVDDVTAEFRVTQSQWLGEWDRRADALRGCLGVEMFETRQQERRTALAVIDEGLLRRSLYVATRP